MSIGGSVRKGEQISAWFPGGTKKRIKRLAGWGESAGAVLARALEVLEKCARGDFVDKNSSQKPEAEGSTLAQVVARQDRQEHVLNLLMTHLNLNMNQPVSISGSEMTQGEGGSLNPRPTPETESEPETGAEPASPPSDYNRAATLTRILQLQADGFSGPSAVARQLNAEGFPTAKGGEWRESAVRSLLKAAAASQLDQGQEEDEG